MASSLKSELATVSAIAHSATMTGKHHATAGGNTNGASSATGAAASSSVSGGLAPATAVPILGAAIGGGVLAIMGLL